MDIRPTAFVLIGALALAGGLAGCGGDDDGDGAAPTATATPRPSATATPPASPTATGGLLDVARCAAENGDFSAELDHPYFTLPVGATWLLTGIDDEGAEVRLEVTALADTEMVAGVATRVVEERESADDELVEIARNFFAIAADGSVCYFGEDVDFYEDGVVVGHDGSWRAGENGNRPGIFLPAEPAVGQRFQQEVAPGIAEDEAEIVAAGETVTVPLGSYTETIRILERNPLDGDESEKIWARAVGLLIDSELARVAE